MLPIDNTARVLPDIANQGHRTTGEPAAAGQLDWVGMGEIEVPVLLAGEDGAAHRVGAKVTAFVNLHRADVRGIHMSRLYLHVDQTLSAEPLSPCSLRRL